LRSSALSAGPPHPGEARPRATFYRWYDLPQTGGWDALEDRSPRPSRVWNRIPDEVREKVLQLALHEPELSARELAVRFTDQQSYFVSEASVYRLLKAQEKAADEFHDKTTAPPSCGKRTSRT
jgi:putative transposase